MNRSNKVTQRCHKDILCTNLIIPIFSETRETIPHTWSLKVGFMSNFTPRCRGWDYHKWKPPDKTPPDLLTTKALVLLWFSIVRQWLNYSWILAMSQLSEAETAGLFAGLRTTASSAASSALACSLSSTSSNISLVYIWLADLDPTQHSAARQERLGFTHWYHHLQRRCARDLRGTLYK